MNRRYHNGKKNKRHRAAACMAAVLLLIVLAGIGGRYRQGPGMSALAGDVSSEKLESVTVTDSSLRISALATDTSSAQEPGGGQAQADSQEAAGGVLFSSEAGDSEEDQGKIPEKYDARDQGKDPVIKSQGDRNTCWALTATSALEASFLPQQRIVFSADHMSLNNGFTITQDEGGDYKMIMAYLTGWYGPVTEEEDPYGDDVSPKGLTAAAHVKGLRLLESADAETFKEQILEYGPVQTSLYMDRPLTQPGQGYYNEETFGYYYPDRKRVTHDVLLLGWDDTYSADNFLTRPPQDGAWICQNTWGEDFADGGIFYVSYCDANITRQGLVYTKVDEGDPAQRIVQNDVCGWQGRIGYASSSCYFAGVFQAQEGESLSGCGFYTLSEKSDYSVYLTRHFENASQLERRSFLCSGTLDGMGFHAVDLPEEVRLEDDERFAVSVYITSEGEDKPVAVEVKKDRFTQQVSLEGRETYLSEDGIEWENTQDHYESNVCLKAYLRSG